MSYLTLANILDETVQVAGPDRIDTGRSGALRPPMVGCGTTAQILGIVCLVLALALCPFTNKTLVPRGAAGPGSRSLAPPAVVYPGSQGDRRR